MRLSRAASRYAKALLSLAVDKGQAKEVNDDMRTVIKTIHDSKDLRNFLSSPIVKSDKKASGLKAVFAKCNSITEGLFHLLTEKNRADILNDVAMSYIIQYEEMNRREIATVTTAVAITSKLEAKILAKAQELAGKEVTLEKKIDPSILGGFILRVGDREVNASVQHKLGDIKRTFASS